MHSSYRLLTDRLILERCSLPWMSKPRLLEGDMHQISKTDDGSNGDDRGQQRSELNKDKNTLRVI